MNFEITAVGFDGMTDATDDRVLWVAAPDLATLENAVAGVPHLGISDVLGASDGDIDYVLPKDAHELRTVLRAFAADLPAKEIDQ
jgi:hypothetical protein